jgi:hypothetical protein
MFLSADVVADIAPALKRLLDEARRDRRQMRPATVEAIEKLDLVGAGWRNRVADVASEVAFLDSTDCIEVRWISMNDAAHVLGITRQATAGLVGRGQIHGDKPGGRWRICADSVSARKAGKKCQH